MPGGFHGIITPLITALNPDTGSPDLESLRRLVEFQIEGGVHGFWAMGTTAEFAAFDEDERAGSIAAVVRQSNGRLPVIANISDCSTRLAIRHGRRAADAGAQAVAATPPYYFPHTQDELLAHYAQIRAAIELPLFLYNIPQTVRVKIELQTAKTLLSQGLIAGIKDSQNDLEWIRQLALFVRDTGSQFCIMAGTRHLIDAAVLAGADGAIPSIANAFPDLAVRVYIAAVHGDYTLAAELQNTIVKIESLYDCIAPGSRNAAVIGALKAVLQRRGIISSGCTSAPLRPVTSQNVEELFSGLAALDPA
ncbi:MAG: dihydrodipicolinate synthase family protein [Chloroflexota bacterium]